MKKFSLFLLGMFLLNTGATRVWADGMPETPVAPTHHYRHKISKKEEALPPPAPVCTPHSDHPKVKLVSWNPTQKVSKFLGVIEECVTTQWDVLRLLSGPNILGLHYPEEKEMWGYTWLWNYKLKNPIEDTLILMDRPGKRIMKGKNPVELYITFNKEDVVERVEMILIKKKNSQYVVSY